MTNLSGSSIAGSTPVRGRVEYDYYATPPETTRAILEKVELNGSILEPACGGGHMAEVIKEYYPDREVVCTDLIYRGYGQGGIDFLSHDYGRNFGTVITNPPFKYMQQFTERALEISTDKVLMFGKIQFLESKRRRVLFEETPLKYVYVFSERQHPMRNGSPFDENGKKLSTVMCFAWFVWEHGYEGEPILRWI